MGSITKRDKHHLSTMLTKVTVSLVLITVQITSAHFDDHYGATEEGEYGWYGHEDEDPFEKWSAQGFDQVWSSFDLKQSDFSTVDALQQLFGKDFASKEFQPVWAEAEGFAAELDALVALAHQSGTDVNEVDLQSRVEKLYRHIQMQLDELEGYIDEQAKDANNEQDVSDVMGASLMFAQLVDMGRILLDQLQVIKPEGTALVDRASTLLQTVEEQAKDVFRFFEVPSQENLLVAINLDNQKHGSFVQFLASVGLNPFAQQQELIGGCYRMRGAYWDDWYLTRDDDPVFRVIMKQGINEDKSQKMVFGNGSEEGYITMFSLGPDLQQYFVCIQDLDLGDGKSYRFTRLEIKQDPFKDCKDRFRFMKVKHGKGGFKWYFIERSRRFTPMTLNGYAVSPLAEPKDEGNQFWVLEKLKDSDC